MPVLGKTKQDVLTEFRSSEILEAARRIFAKKGFSQATVDDIADAAGVAKGTVYLYFHSKRAVYLAALRHGIEALHQRTSERLAAADSVSQKVRTFIETRIEYFDENRDFFKIYYSEVANVFTDPRRMDAELNRLYSKQARNLAAVLKEGIERGEIRDLPPLPTSYAIYDLVRGVIARRLLDGSKISGPEESAFLLDLVWKGIQK
jgi:AcrR family transcriptional regulator